MTQRYFSASLINLCEELVAWRKSKGFHTDWDNVPEKLMLIVTEASEAMEAFRKIVPSVSPEEDDSYVNLGEELADIVIRTLELGTSLGYNMANEIASKMEFNESRPYKHGKER